jgi:hypothetical protein
LRRMEAEPRGLTWLVSRLAAFGAAKAVPTAFWRGVDPFRHPRKVRRPGIDKHPGDPPVGIGAVNVRGAPGDVAHPTAADVARHLAEFTVTCSPDGPGDFAGHAPCPLRRKGGGVSFYDRRTKWAK